jgi:spore maturation protein B
MKEILQAGATAVSAWAVPVMIGSILVAALWKRLPVYEEFVEGAKEGFQVGLRIIPFLVAMLVAMGMFRASGAIDILKAAAAPILGTIGFPPDLLPMALMRPLSGSGALGIFTEIAKSFGPDSLLGRQAATMVGCSETTFYVLAVYFGSVAVTRTRHAVFAGLLADLAGFLTAIWICRLVFA